MLISEAIAQCTALTGQVVANSVLVRWLSELDGRLAIEFYRTDAWTPYDPTDDLSCELLVQYPWDGIYIHHLAAQTYFSNGEYDRYENERVMSEKVLTDFRAFMQRTQSRLCGCGGFPTEKSGGTYVTVVPKQAERVWYWISAYSIAVKHGFHGTEEEWLDSLVGPQGPEGPPGEIDSISADTVTDLTGALTGNGSNVEARAIENTAPATGSTALITSGAVATAVNGKYTKPSGGIPASDIASGVVPSAYTSNPAMNGDADPGSSGSWAKGDHVHPSDTTKAPNNHRSSATTYGVGNGSYYGHVKLSDATDGTSGVSGGIAATPAAVKAAYDKGDAALPKAGGTMTGAIDMGSEKITNLATPTANADAATKQYVDGHYVTAGQKYGTTLGEKATAEGQNATASGNYSHAEGSYATASGNYSHAEGYGTIASDNYSHAEGVGATASGYNSHAEGDHTTASGMNSHAECERTTASGRASHSEGAYTTASAYASHAEGDQTNASADSSHAEGQGTAATGRSQHVFGEYNQHDTAGTTARRGAYVEIVGNGTANNLSNARTLDWSGNEVLAGKLTVGAAPTANMDVTTKQYVDTGLSGKQNTLTFDTTPTAGSYNPVTSLGIRAAIDQATGSPLVASTVSEMTDTSKIYVYTGSETGYTSGHWYYYNGTAWTDGGVYNAVAVNTDTTLTLSGEPADAKVTGDRLSELRSAINFNDGEILAGLSSTSMVLGSSLIKSENKQDVFINKNMMLGTSISSANGLPVYSATLDATHAIVIEANTKYYISKDNGAIIDPQRVSFFDSNYVFLSSTTSFGSETISTYTLKTVTTPANAKYMHVIFAKANDYDYNRIRIQKEFSLSIPAMELNKDIRIKRYEIEIPINFAVGGLASQNGEEVAREDRARTGFLPNIYEPYGYEVTNYKYIVYCYSGMSVANYIGRYPTDGTWTANPNTINNGFTYYDGCKYVRILAKRNDDGNVNVSDLNFIYGERPDAFVKVENEKQDNRKIASVGTESSSIIVSRLGSREYPEQTVEAFIQAFKDGYNAILCDVQITSDGYFVCVHDTDFLNSATIKNADGTTVSVNDTVSNNTLLQLNTKYDFGVYKGSVFAGTEVPMLEDVMKLCHALNLTLFLETKVQLTRPQLAQMCDMAIKYSLNETVIWAADETYDNIDDMKYFMDRMPQAGLLIRRVYSESSVTSIATILSTLRDTYKNNKIYITVRSDGMSYINSTVSTLRNYNIALYYSALETQEQFNSFMSNGYNYLFKFIASYYDVNSYVINHYGI